MLLGFASLVLFLVWRYRARTLGGRRIRLYISLSVVFSTILNVVQLSVEVSGPERNTLPRWWCQPTPARRSPSSPSPACLAASLACHISASASRVHMLVNDSFCTAGNTSKAFFFDQFPPLFVRV